MSKRKEGEFIPNEEQLAFAEKYLETCGNIEKSFTSIGTTKTKFYTVWKKDERFDPWLQKWCEKQVLKRCGLWFAIAEREAKKGSYKHLQMLMQIANKFVPNMKHEHGFDENMKKLIEDKFPTTTI